MAVKKTVYKGYTHTCDIITVYLLTYHDIRLDILICLSVYIYTVASITNTTKETYMKMFYNIIGCFIICFKRYRCRNFIISFKIKTDNTEKSINYNKFSNTH